MKPRDIWNRLFDDKQERDRLKSVVRVLFDIFLDDWYRWEVMGWVLALHMGFSKDEIQKSPELGWFAKVALAAALLQSEDRDDKILGRALLYHTELPPADLFVIYGGELIPAVIYHYRTSSNWRKAWKDVDDVLERMKRFVED